MPNVLPAPDAVPPAVVLDTNVVLDWLVFRDPVCLPLDAAIRAGRLRWCATGAMRQELELVLTRDKIAARLDWAAPPLTTWTRFARFQNDAPLSALLCSDPDDQKFIDLAMHLGDSVLLSRDRAVLALSRRAGQLGLRITTPAAWAGALPRLHAC